MIPEEWSVATLREIGTFSKGSGIKKDDVLEAGIPCIRYGQIYTEFENVIKHVRTFVSGTVAKSSRQLTAGEILFAGSGETKEEIGKCVAYIEDVGAVAGGDIVILTPKGADSCFLGFALNAHDVVVQKTERAQGDAVVHISASSLASIQVLLPPLDEQRAIAEALSDADALVESLDALIAKRRDMKQAAMQQLLTGRTRLPGFADDWSSTPVAEVANLVAGGTPSTSVAEYWDGDIPWCTPTDITSTEGNTLFHTDRTITQAGLTASAANLLPEGSLLLCTRATVGDVRIAGQPTATNQGFKSLVVKSPNDNVFIYYQLATLRNRLLELSSGSTFLELSKKDLARVELLLPPPEEQQAIAEILSDMDAEIDALVAQREKAELVKQGMMQELLSGRVRLV